MFLLQKMFFFLLFIHTSSSQKKIAGCQALCECRSPSTMKTWPLSQVLLLAVDYNITSTCHLGKKSLSVGVKSTCLSSQKISACRAVAGSLPQLLSPESLAPKGSLVQTDPPCAQAQVQRKSHCPANRIKVWGPHCVYDSHVITTTKWKR